MSPPVVVEVREHAFIHAIAVFVHEKCEIREGVVELHMAHSRQDDGGFVRGKAGDGLTRFVHEGGEYWMRRERKGAPMAVHGDSRFHEVVHLGGPSHAAIQTLCTLATEDDEDNGSGFRTHTWDAQNEFWKRQSRMLPRPWDSVVLDDKVKRRIETELDRFVGKATRTWYESMGIPYRRGILLHGPPGSGKTSTIAAIATRLRRNVYRVTPDRRLTDSGLQQALTNVRTDASIIVFEDVDCLFDLHRDKACEDSSVSFSGLLNALDGLQDPAGALFLYTTNHVERLDPALRRKGRVDLEIELGYCSPTQASTMFRRFYPASTDKDATAFAEKALRVMPKLTAATMQDFFVRMRTENAATALANVDFGNVPSDKAASGMWS